MLIQYYLLVAILLAGWYGLYRLWKRRLDADIEEGARVEFEHLSRADPQLLEGLDLARFRAIYGRVETPRAPFHVFLAVAIFLVGAPFVLAATTMSIRAMELAGMIPQPAEQARQLRVSADGIRLIEQADLTALQLILEGWGGFFSFFALLFFWVAVFYLVMRRSHSLRAGSLREEVLRSR